MFETLRKQLRKHRYKDHKGLRTKKDSGLQSVKKRRRIHRGAEGKSLNTEEIRSISGKDFERL